MKILWKTEIKGDVKVKSVALLNNKTGEIGDITSCPVKQVGAATEAFCYVKRPYYCKG